tara:strand:- start:5593 stop:6987 length:1395 start_codon:yes stop_codon:yes gene_type:complete
MTACEGIETPDIPISPICDQSADVNAFTQSEEVTQRFIITIDPRGRMGPMTLSHYENQKNNLEDAAGQGSDVQSLVDDIYLVKTSLPMNSRQVMTRLSRKAKIKRVEVDYPLHAFELTNDPKLERQWAHEVVNSSGAWNISTGSEDVVVGVIDSGVDDQHPDLNENMWRNPNEIVNGKDDDGNGYIDDIYGWDFVDEDRFPRPGSVYSSHGTHVAGTIGAVGNNGIGISGHAQTVKIMSLRFLDSNGSGYTSDAIRAIDYGVRNGARILNNSWGGSRQSRALKDAITRAQRAGVIFVAAAGNSGRNVSVIRSYPSGYSHSNIISVAASTQDDRLASFSNFSKKRVDLAAPGVDIYSTSTENGYETLSGTSMATPLVSGVVALMLSVKPDLTYLQVNQLLYDHVDRIWALRNSVKTGGRINAANTLRAVAQLVPEPSPVPVPEPDPLPEPDPEDPVEDIPQNPCI